MKAVIRLELFGRSAIRGIGDYHKPWVARITGITGRGSYKRDFLKPLTDYGLANSVGSRGIFRYYYLDDGVYEVSERVDWKRVEHYFIAAHNGEYERIGQMEINRQLKGAGYEGHDNSRGRNNHNQGDSEG